MAYENKLNLFFMKTASDKVSVANRANGSIAARVDYSAKQNSVKADDFGSQLSKATAKVEAEESNFTKDSITQKADCPVVQESVTEPVVKDEVQQVTAENAIDDVAVKDMETTTQDEIFEAEVDVQPENVESDDMAALLQYMSHSNSIDVLLNDKQILPMAQEKVVEPIAEAMVQATNTVEQSADIGTNIGSLTQFADKMPNRGLTESTSITETVNVQSVESASGVVDIPEGFQQVKPMPVQSVESASGAVDIPEGFQQVKPMPVQSASVEALLDSKSSVANGQDMLSMLSGRFVNQHTTVQQVVEENLAMPQAVLEGTSANTVSSDLMGDVVPNIVTNIQNGEIGDIAGAQPVLNDDVQNIVGKVVENAVGEASAQEVASANAQTVSKFVDNGMDMLNNLVGSKVQVASEPVQPIVENTLADVAISSVINNSDVVTQTAADTKTAMPVEDVKGSILADNIDVQLTGNADNKVTEAATRSENPVVDMQVVANNTKQEGTVKVESAVGNVSGIVEEAASQLIPKSKESANSNQQSNHQQFTEQGSQQFQPVNAAGKVQPIQLAGEAAFDVAPIETNADTAASVAWANVQQPAMVDEADNTQQVQQPQQSTTDYEIPKQIVEQARLIRVGHDTEMVIKLNPQHLGELTLKVAVHSNGAVTAAFHSDNATVRGIIESSMIQLKHDLAEQGIKVDKIEISAGLQQDLQDMGQGYYAQQGGQQRTASRNDLSNYENGEVVEGESVEGVASVDGVPVNNSTEPIRDSQGNVISDGVDYRI